MNYPVKPPEVPKEIIDLVLKISDKSLYELMGVVEDQIRFWRWKNQITMLFKANEFLKTKGISPQKVNLKILVPLLDYSSLEEDGYLQEKWIQLLITAIDPNEEVEVLPSFPEILKVLSSTEVKILDYLYNKDAKLEKTIEFDKIKEHLKISNENIELFMNNLTRLGLCIIPSNAIFDGSWKTFNGNSPLPITSTDKIILTRYGYNFIKACTKNNGK